MAVNVIRGAKRRGKPRCTTTPDPSAQRRADLVERDFTAQRPNPLCQLELALVEYIGGSTTTACTSRSTTSRRSSSSSCTPREARFPATGSVAGSSPRAANGLTRPRILLGDPVEAQNGADPALSRSTLAAAVAPSETPGPPIDERAAGGSLRSRYALAALTAGAQPTTIR